MSECCLYAKAPREKEPGGLRSQFSAYKEQPSKNTAWVQNSVAVEAN